jgi:lantibiotic modifying enzyme
MRLAKLTGLRGSGLIELLACTLADRPSGELDPLMLLRAINSAAHVKLARRRHSSMPLFTTATHESILTQGLETLTAELRSKVDRLQARHIAHEAVTIDVHSGIAGLLYVLAVAHGAKAAHLDARLGERAVRVLTGPTPVSPDLPGLVHGRAGRALAVAVAVQAGCISAGRGLRTHLLGALQGPLDWPDFTHGAAGQGFAALACARRLGLPELAAPAPACAAYLVRTQNPEGAWTLPEGVSGTSGERFTGFAHGAAGMMGFLGRYAATASDAAANAAWRRAEAWLVSRARRARAGRWQWPQGDLHPAPAYWWCHGAPGIALGWLCVAQAQGIVAIAEEYLRGALNACPTKLRNDGAGQCHGLAGVGEVYLEAYRVLREECWRERAADIANVLVALFRRRSRQPWLLPSAERPADADGLMLGTAGVLHFLVRYHYPSARMSAPLLE